MSMLLNKRTLFISLIAASSVTQAQQEEGVTIAPSIGYYNMDNHRGVDNTTALSLGLGYQFDNPWAVEFVYLNADSDTSVSGNNVDVDQYRLDALYHLAEQGNWSPYLAAGVGTTDFSPGENNALINAGGGVKYALNQDFSLRADFRLIKDTEDHELDNLTMVGLHYVFGAKPAPTQEVESIMVQAADTDNDGVIDKSDQCLNTPAGVSVDMKGCALDSDKDGVADHKDQCLNTPAGVSVDMKGCVLDSDNDGVVDHKDQCLNTPAGVSVNMKGCALDSDNDGVANHLDVCPNSKVGSKVDAQGCYIALKEAKSIRLDVQFASNSTLVNAKYFPQIRKVAAFLKEYPKANVVIEGHTDNSGSAAYNQSLSEKRAQAIAHVLTKDLGVESSRVSAIGYGEEKPLMSNDSAENREANRRVIAVISSK
ncbi:flagellar motor protein MotB [Marinomonas rhizomae]|uniref:OOP family OmpA-OmpF porin n=1 Tax=Marinomonas rhizomae TaxID=491948 RepID=A0A366JA94_9GAMM|nr:OmpA family protein [Marinomonas rhizomae]RBP83777.1 OOP family OmpA-OmpF porin [Marinomonas rhizomae]RNF73510.1 flagellar motor protein MotB [Marinomonas rhizomae]